MSLKSFFSNFATFLVTIATFALLVTGLFALTGGSISPHNVTIDLMVRDITSAFGFGFICCIGIMMLAWALPPTSLGAEFKEIRYGPLLFAFATFFCIICTYCPTSGYGMVFSTAAVFFAGILRYIATRDLETATFRGRTIFILLIDFVVGCVVAFAGHMFTINDYLCTARSATRFDLGMMPTFFVHIALLVVAAYRGGVMTCLVMVANSAWNMVAYASSEFESLRITGYYYIGIIPAAGIAAIVSIVLLCKKPKQKIEEVAL